MESVESDASPTLQRRVQGVIFKYCTRRCLQTLATARWQTLEVANLALPHLYLVQMLQHAAPPFAFVQVWYRRGQLR